MNLFSIICTILVIIMPKWEKDSLFMVDLTNKSNWNQRKNNCVAIALKTHAYLIVKFVIQR